MIGDGWVCVCNRLAVVALLYMCGVQASLPLLFPPLWPTDLDSLCHLIEIEVERETCGSRRGGGEMTVFSHIGERREKGLW